jgi:hypothetical protein
VISEWNSPGVLEISKARAAAFALVLGMGFLKASTQFLVIPQLMTS